MLHGFSEGALELRAAPDGSQSLKGRFPYNKPAVLSDGGRSGRPRKEVIAPGAFSYRVDDEDEDIHLLVGHSYDRPLASRAAGTFLLRDTPAALTFTATITAEMQRVSYVQDFLGGYAAGLITGISPGFRIPPERVVPEAERTDEEDPKLGMALIRTVLQALLYELSVVTKPAYPEAQIEARNWSLTDGGVVLPDGPDTGLHRTLSRWRM